MNIVGIGIDLVEISRIRDSVNKFGDAFLNRIYCTDELAYCLSLKSRDASLAARFAVKEAVAKALGTGIGGEFGWKDVEVGRRESGEPYLIFHGAGRLRIQNRGITRTFVTLSHAENYAIAQVILTQDEE